MRRDRGQTGAVTTYDEGEMDLSWMPRLVEEYPEHVLGSRLLLYFLCAVLAKR